MSGDCAHRWRPATVMWSLCFCSWKLLSDFCHFLLGNAFYCFASCDRAASAVNVLRIPMSKQPDALCYFSSAVSALLFVEPYCTTYLKRWWLCNNCFCIYKYTVFCGQSQYFVSFFNLFWTTCTFSTLFFWQLSHKSLLQNKKVTKR